MPTRVYIAAPYPCIEDANDLASRFVDDGIVVTSRWLRGDGDLSPTWARRDLGDVAAADVLVALNPPEWHERGTGGRHVELGFALAMWKPIVLVGEISNIFHRLPEVRHALDADAAVALVRGLVVDRYLR
jgi:hypothetical protein